MDAAPASEPSAVISPPRRVWRAIRARWWLRWPFDLAVLWLIVWGFGRYQARNLLDDRTPAPAFALTDLDGQTRALADYRGKTVVLLFFAPWCTVCSLESDNWARLKSWRHDVEVLAVALSYEKPDEIVEFVGEDRGAYPVLYGNASVQRDYRVESFPTHYIIDPEGRVAWQGTGYTPTVTLWLRL